jgi:hypothetical protein
MKYNLINKLLNLSAGLIIGYIIISNYKTSYHGPNSNDVKKLIFEDENGKYKLLPQIFICPY